MSKTKLAGGVAAAAIVIATPFLMMFEGSEPEVYLDTGKVPTVCVGHTGPEVKLGDRWSKLACDEALSSDVQIAAMHVENYVTVELNSYEYAAYVSFVFNVGPTQFKSSTLLRKLNAGDHVGACDQLPRWVYDNGKRLNGLVKRRAAERELCLKGL